jgi:hypothetical protein
LKIHDASQTAHTRDTHALRIVLFLKELAAMWLVTPVGFFSIVQKAADQNAGTLTVRARVHGDLDALREYFLPGLGDIHKSSRNDYRFRTVAPRDEVAAALSSMIHALDYSNFKSEVARVQGAGHRRLYHEVWDALYKLQAEAKKHVSVVQRITRAETKTASWSKSRASAARRRSKPGVSPRPSPA